MLVVGCGSVLDSVLLCFFVVFLFFFLLMIRRPPRSTLDRSSAASDVYKRQGCENTQSAAVLSALSALDTGIPATQMRPSTERRTASSGSVSYTHLRAHETVLDLVCRLLLEKKKTKNKTHTHTTTTTHLL